MSEKYADTGFTVMMNDVNIQDNIQREDFLNYIKERYEFIELNIEQQLFVDTVIERLERNETGFMADFWPSDDFLRTWTEGIIDLMSISESEGEWDKLDYVNNHNYIFMQ
jgi:hypothetical protein